MTKVTHILSRQKTFVLCTLLCLMPLPAAAQSSWGWSVPPRQQPYSNLYQSPQIYDSQGNFRGNLNGNRYDPDSISNPYGRYGSPYSPESLNNPYGTGTGFGAPVVIVPSR